MPLSDVICVYHYTQGGGVWNPCPMNIFIDKIDYKKLDKQLDRIGREIVSYNGFSYILVAADHASSFSDDTRYPKKGFGLRFERVDIPPTKRLRIGYSQNQNTGGGIKVKTPNTEKNCVVDVDLVRNDDTVVLKCPICGCGIAWAVSGHDGAICSSAYVDGFDMCHECLIEHCVATMCADCKVNKKPTCDFLGTKKYYLERDDE